MLKVDESVIACNTAKLYQLKNGCEIYCRTVRGKSEGKTAIFIHGGGSGGNHTMLLRPAKWLIEKKLFACVILPDRRGEGNSTPLTKKHSISDHAKDMNLLLDELSVREKITAIGLSYGGPIALQLAGFDNRIDEVILMASSPSLKEVKGIRGLLYRYKVLELFSKLFYKKNLGKLPSEYPNFETVYDLKSEKELMNYFIDAIKKTDKKMLQSLLFQNASTLDKKNNSVNDNLYLDIPIYQIIGAKDEIWETNLSNYKKHFTNIKTIILPGKKHKGVILKSHLFYEKLLKIYKSKAE